jgi:hypothetical protein
MLIVTNKTQRNIIFFIVVKALHVSGSFPAHHQELKNCTCSIWLSLVAAANDGQRGCPKHVEFYNRINLDN